MTQYLIGADPEIFLQHTNTRQFISAHGLIKGTKENPTKVRYGAHQVDGMALEFNIEPALTQKHFTRNILNVKASLERKIKKVAPNLSLAVTPVAHFTQKHMEKTPDEAKILGCEPDYNAYTGDLNQPPNANTRMRTCAGHIHIGWTEGKDPLEQIHFEDCKRITQALDNSLYIFSHLWDTDTKRRQLYGKPGAFRPKPYGVEYRVLSNAWLKDKTLIDFVFAVTTLVCNDQVIIDNLYPKRTGVYFRKCDSIHHTINNILFTHPKFRALLTELGEYWPLENNYVY